MTVLKRDGTTQDAPTYPRAVNAPGSKKKEIKKKLEKREGPSPVTLTTTVTKTVKIT